MNILYFDELANKYLLFWQNTIEYPYVIELTKEIYIDKFTNKYFDN